MSNVTASKPRLKTSAMIASIAGEGQLTRSAPFGHALVELARQKSNVVGMTADLGKYTDLHIFAKEFPERYYQMGMAEQLLMGAAAGLAHEGAQPFVTTYAVFATRRAYDFMHQAIAEDNLDVKIVCALPGLTTGYGPSHQAAEDLALMRAMPNMTGDRSVRCARHRADGARDCRAQRSRVCASVARQRARRARRIRLPVRARQGEDAARRRRACLVISSGIMTMRALEVAKALENDRIGVGVLHVPTIKRRSIRGDDRCARQKAARGRLVVVAENRPTIGGFGRKRLRPS